MKVTMTNTAFFRRLRLAAFLFAALTLSVSAQWNTPAASDDAAPLVNNGQPVNDFANVIDDATEAQLNQKLKDYMKRTNPPVAISVVTVRTTAGRDTFEYSLAIARGWKIGSDKDDNPSALLFVAIDDRKYQTQISRDLEDELTDGLAGQLQRQYLVPAFKAGNYAKGISDTVDAYIRRIDEKQAAEPGSTTGGGTTTPTAPRTTGVSSATGSTIIRAVCCLIVIIILLAIIFGRSKGGRGGGGGYGGGGGSALPWIIGSIIANSGSGSSGSSWGSSDSGSSWGGGGGGSSDWGGFGGGGDFGGGGSGGSW